MCFRAPSCKPVQQGYLSTWISITSTVEELQWPWQRKCVGECICCDTATERHHLCAKTQTLASNITAHLLMKSALPPSIHIF